MTRPNCKCHGEPMLRNGWDSGKQKWCCGVKRRAGWHRYYARMDGLTYARIVLKTRRWHALRRMEARRGAV